MSEDDVLKDFFPIIRDEKTGALIWKDLRRLELQYEFPVAGLKKFLEGLAKGILYGTRCRSCGAKYFPPRIHCSSCGSSEVEWVEVSKKGRLLSYTVVNVKPESYQKYPDYIVGIAETDDGFRILAWIKCDDFSKLRRGMPVRVEIEKRKEDDLQIYCIVPEL